MEKIFYIKLLDTISGQEKQNVVIVYEAGSESNLKIEYKIVDNSKYDISYLKKDFEIYDNNIDAKCKKIIVLISDQYFHLQIFDDHLLDYQRYDIWNIKYNKGEIN